jgi:poly(A)-specific ribonuclease
MVGGDLSGLDPNDFLTYVEGRQEEVVEEVKALKALLENKRTVLVGHNIFMDLMYFYKCFFGTLPARVEDFQRIIHNLFPSIIDTKFLATYNLDNPAMANSSLEQLNVELEMLPFDKVPIISVCFDQ